MRYFETSRHFGSNSTGAAGQHMRRKWMDSFSFKFERIDDVKLEVWILGLFLLRLVAFTSSLSSSFDLQSSSLEWSSTYSLPC